MSQMYKVEVTASGEVRDKDGNLLSTSEVVFDTEVITEERAIELGLITKENAE